VLPGAIGVRASPEDFTTIAGQRSGRESAAAIFAICLGVSADGDRITGESAHAWGATGIEPTSHARQAIEYTGFPSLVRSCCLATSGE
jgi:hypothetical protein